MTLLTEPTRIVLAKTFALDSDAQTYITAVETADGQALETNTRYAINNFVIGCKQDGIWGAIKASCILAGARTKEGAVVPLTNASNAAPTLNGTAGGWSYNRKTGLAGNGTDNYIDSGRNNNAETSQSSKHLSFYATATALTSNRSIIGTNTTTGNPSWYIWRSGNDLRSRINQGVNTDFSFVDTTLGFKGINRPDASSVSARYGGKSFSGSGTSGTPLNENISVFRASGSFLASTTRLAFYSIGESLDLALLDARVTDLINAFAAAIP